MREENQDSDHVVTQKVSTGKPTSLTRKAGCFLLGMNPWGPWLLWSSGSLRVYTFARKVNTQAKMKSMVGVCVVQEAVAVLNDRVFEDPLMITYFV